MTDKKIPKGFEYHVPDDYSITPTDRCMMALHSLGEKFDIFEDYHSPIVPKCKDCSYDGDDLLRPCNYNLMKDALALIQCQQAEIEALKHEREISIEDLHHSADQINEQLEEIEKLNVELVGMRGACNSYKMHYDNAKAEIERLQIRLRKERHQFEDLGKMYSEIRAEAIKEFAERLKKEKYSVCAGHGLSDYVVSVWDINNLVKEMVGEQG